MLESQEKTVFKLNVEKDGPLNGGHAVHFSQCPHFDEFDIRGQDLFTVRDAKKVELIRSVFELTIWCDVTRAAVRSLVSRPNLRQLVLFGLKPSGQLTQFERAEDLTYFSCFYDLNGNDLLEVAKLPKLQKLGAQYARITEEALSALLDKPLLTDIDFECSNFDDYFAEMIAQSKTVLTLELGDTKITKVGLEKICSMKQLRGLDIWSNDIGEPEIDLLAGLPNLEYLSIGGHCEQTTFTAKSTLPKLNKLPSLKRVWLDGFRVTRDEWEDLNQRYDDVQVTAIIDR